jgi:hypothetical protein
MSPRHAASALRRASQLVRNIQMFEKIKIKIRSGVCQWCGQLTKINFTIRATYGKLNYYKNQQHFCGTNLW